MKRILVSFGLAPVALALAQTTQTNAPSFASEWRVTGFIRQGGGEEASVERAGLRPRFVREGDRLPGDVIVLEVSYDNRSVLLSNGRETDTIRPEATMAPPPPPPKSAVQASQKAALKKDNGPKPLAVDRVTAVRDKEGRWSVVFPSGKNIDMTSYVERHGGLKGAADHVRELMERETDPERIEYRKQQLYILKQMSRRRGP